MYFYVLLVFNILDVIIDEEMSVKKNEDNPDDKRDLEIIMADVLALNSQVQHTLKNVITVSSNLSTNLEHIVLERKSEPSFSVGKESAVLLVNLNKTSATLLSQLQKDESFENPEFTEELNVDMRVVENFDNYIKGRDEFNKYLKLITMGIQKMAMNSKIVSNDSGRHSPASIGINTTSSSTLSDDFDINLHLASSSFLI